MAENRSAYVGKPSHHYSVIFEISCQDKSCIDLNQIIDASQHSMYQAEEEIIFAPGSLFKVTNFDKNE